MRKLYFRIQAARDIVEIRRYITRRSGSRTVAAEFIAKLRNQCRKLAGLPGLMGRERPDLPGNLRTFPFGNYIIVFQYRENYFEVVSIIERHRDLNALFDGK